MKVVGYLRVSTQRQADEGLGLEVQREAIARWAEKEGHQLVAFCTDSGISGSNGIETRLGLADALGLLNDGPAQGLIVYRLDRLARDLVLQEQLLAEVRRMGAYAFSTSAGESQFLSDDPNDPSRALIRQVLGAVAEFERATIRMRLRAGKARKAAGGGFIGGPPPFGYAVRDKQLVPNPAEQTALGRLRELHATGQSFSSIARQLNAEGLPPRRAEAWSHAAVRLIASRAG